MKTIETALTEIFNSIVENVQVIIITRTTKFRPVMVPVKKRPNSKRQ